MRKNLNNEHRKSTLQKLIECRIKPAEMRAALAEFDWDCKNELIQLEKSHIAVVLESYLAKERSKEEVEDWANLIECRDDIGYEEVAEVLHVLANPGITHELTEAVAASLVDELMKPNTPLEPIR